MLTSLISTKLRSPQLRADLVTRPRLTEKLEPMPGRRLTLVSAPAGFGKTTLLGEWLEAPASGERSVAWVSLDEGDNDPARFISYMVAAFRDFHDGIGEGVLSSLRSPQPAPLEALVGALVNDLADIRGEKVLILDDYHVIEAEPVHGIVSFLLEHLPEDMHLVIASRVDPPLPLSRLRARGQMAELRAADLAMTPEEVAAFLGGVMGLDLSAEDVAALEERTEGWIAGLQLAALSMRDREDLSGFVGAFSGSHRDVLDFLAGEVLDRQPEGVREFLLETSIADHLTGALCDALTGRPDGQETLERLERENLFVVALDDERRWYRYHHLFADFLRGRLERESPEEVKELRLRAAAWYEREGRASEAVGHALAAEDHERAARLIEQVVGEKLVHGEVLTLLGWLEALPEETKRERPRLLLENAISLMWIGRPDDIEPLLREVERAASATGQDPREDPPETDESDRRYLLGYATAIRSWLVYLRGDPLEAIELARRALEVLPEDPAPRSFAALSLGMAYRNTDDLEAASQALAEAAELGWASGNTYVAESAMTYLARLQMARGRLREAEDVLRRTLRVATEQSDASLPVAGWVSVTLGELLYERDDLDAAEARLTEGMELAERTADIGSLVDAHVALSRMEQARGDAEGALESARDAEHLARSTGVVLLDVYAAAWKARVHLAMGDVAAAVREQERAAGAGGIPPSEREGERIGTARLLIARGEQDEALRLLTQLHEAAASAGRDGSAIQIQVLRALALWARDEKQRAVGTLAEALAMAEPEGYVRIFVDEGAPMAELLSAALEAQQRGSLDPPVPAHYARKLLAAAERTTTPAAGGPRSSGQLPEPLSERELEVLVLIAAGETNREIAKELFVSVGTVKTHAKNIYRKLDAHSRTQAASTARDLGLI